jgi:hypothetical protein
MFHRSTSVLIDASIAVLAGTLGALLLALIVSPQTARATSVSWTVISSNDDVNDGNVISHTGSLRFVLAHALNGDDVSFHIVGVDKIYVASPLTVPVGVAVGYRRDQPCGDYHTPRINVEAYTTAIDPVFNLSADATLRNVDIGGGRISVRVGGSNVDVCGSGLGVEYDSDGNATPLPPTALALAIDGDHAVIHRNYLNGQIAVSPLGSDSRLGDTITGTGEINEGVHDAAVTVLANGDVAAQRVTIRDPFPRALFGLSGPGVLGGDDVITHTNNWAQRPSILSAYTPDNFATVEVRGIANPLSEVDVFFDTQVSVTRQLPVVADATGVFSFTGNLPGNHVLAYAVSTLNDPAYPNRQGSSSQLSAPVEVTALPPTQRLQVSPDVITFTAILSQPNPAVQNVIVMMPPLSPTLAWHLSVSTTDGLPWLAAAPLIGSGNGTISVTVDATGLSPGTYHGTVSVVDEADPTDHATINVVFELNAPPPPMYHVTVAYAGSGNGTVNKTPNQVTYPAGSIVTLTAVPHSGSIFGGWSGAIEGSASPMTLTLNADQMVTATFELGQLPSANAGQGQTVKSKSLVTLDGSGSLEPGNHTPLTFGWQQIGGVSVSLNGAATNHLTFTAPDVVTQTQVLTFSLVVTNSIGLASEPAQVSITVEPYRNFLPLVWQ